MAFVKSVGSIMFATPVGWAFTAAALIAAQRLAAAG